MVRLNRIYTRTGDDGTTGLVGGERVPKDHLRIEAYGTVDELNATVGLCRDANARLGADEATRSHLDARLEHVQQTLFNLGSSLATPLAKRWAGQPVVTDSDVAALEAEIDEMNGVLEPLQSFVLPGGGPVCAALHHARTVCRRAERATLRLSREVQIDAADLRYLNRLSDWIFVASRWAARGHGEAEALWMP
jgi:cob(I)alamin adenosyltransferase